MSPINASSTQQAQAAQQPAQNTSKTLDTALKVAGVALAVIAVGAIFAQLPAELLITAVVLTGFAALTFFCITAIANSPSTGGPIIYTPSYRPRPFTFFRSDSPVFYRAPVVLPPRTITIPSYRPAPMPVSFRPAPMPARGIDPRPMREPVGIRR